MSNVATLPIEADRYGACVRQIYIRGMDLTGVAMRAQVRLIGDTPGAPLVDLQTVTNGNAEGLRLVGIDTVEGLPVSHVEMVINESTMEGLPYSGELGSPTSLAWDWQLIIAGRKQRIARGEFVITGDGVTGADNAPANRPWAWAGSRAPSGGMRSGAALTFGDEKVDLTIDGANLVAAQVSRATTAQDRAEAAQQRADLAAGAAQGTARYFTTRAAGGTSGGSTEIGRALTPATMASAQGAGMVGYLAAYLGAKFRSLKSRLLSTVDVMDFGAVGNGIADDTAAFNAALATGKRVIVPATRLDGANVVRATYAVADISVLAGMQIKGEKNGWNDAPLLMVNKNGSSAFLNSSSEILFYPTFENLACTVVPGVSGASFFRQQRMDRYTAYATFRNIETYLDLTVSYKIAPIYAVWDRCRDGGLGNLNGNEHTAVSALADSYGQRDQLNVVSFKDCVFNNATGGQGAIIASYACSWEFKNCGFEACQVSAIVGYNLEGLTLDKCWIEGIRAPNTMQLRSYPNTAAASQAVIKNTRFVFNGTAGVPVEEVLGIDNLGTVALEHNEFHLVPAGVKLTNTGARITVCLDNRAVSGPGAASFFDGAHNDTYWNGRRLLQGAADNGVTGMTMQTADGFAAPLGFLSRVNLDVGTNFASIAESQTGLGGTVTVSGFDPAGGAQFRFVKNWLGPTLQDAAPPINNTGRAFTFQIVANSLQMKVDAGGVKVTTTMQH